MTPSQHGEAVALAAEIAEHRDIRSKTGFVPRYPLEGEQLTLVIDALRLYDTPVSGAVREALEDLLQHVDDDTCVHENTSRGGAIWTICDDCGRKWADDRGGFKPHCDAEPVAKARAALAVFKEAR